MSYTKAVITENSAYLNTEFGQSLALRRLGLTLEQLEEIVGRYSRGKRKGELRHKLVWFKVVSGGWVHGFGVVKTPNLTFGYRIIDFNGEYVYNAPPEECSALIAGLNYWQEQESLRRKEQKPAS